jgi:hypothetical protein
VRNVANQSADSAVFAGTSVAEQPRVPASAASFIQALGVKWNPQS